MTMKICIPTYMREENQKAWKKMPESVQKLVTLVTHSGRARTLFDANPTAKLVDLGKTDGIADVRQKVIEHYAEKGFDKILIIDDGCTFKRRNAEMKLVDMDEEAYLEMFKMIEDQLDHYAMVGISDQGGNNRVLESVKEIGRSYSCYGVNIKMFAENDIRFDGMYRKNNEVKLYEDFYVILKMLTKGMKNAVIYDYAFNHPHGKKGGNSTVRTNELQKQCLLALQSEFPGLVELVKKEDPNWKAGLNDTDDFRWEARISWAKAYQQSQSSRASLSDFFQV